MDHRVAELFDQAVEWPQAERADRLARACAGDTALLVEVERLLRADAKARGFLDAAPWVPKSGSDDAPETRSDPVQFGPFRVIRKIGNGGMGEVWLAERHDGDFEQRVAIKQVAWPTPGLLQRFREERRILASLEHPSIARLIDGGVDEQGAPWLAMEYVEGTSILEFARSNLPELRDRIGLFLRVCDAVRFAHQNLVVHRDLKPSNILVTEDGTPKLLDFGIAKVLDANTGERTSTGLLTPGYAAPEQWRGGAITTATDVFALGVVLFELLTGVRPQIPLPGHAADADPPVPLASACPGRATLASRGLVRQLRGDLDRILVGALAADPGQRYESAEALAGDLRRWLSGLPISLRGDRAGYRLRKFRPVTALPWLRR